MFAEDPNAFVNSEFGSPVIFGIQVAWALFDQPDANLLSGRAQSTQYRIEYPRAALVGLRRDDIVLIGIGPGWKFDATGSRLEYFGTSRTPESAQFRVQEVNRLDDALFVEAKLERV